MRLLSALAPLAQPLGLLWLCSLGAAVYLITKRNWRGTLFAVAVAAFIWAVGGTPLAAGLMVPLESPYATADLGSLPSCDAVVVLGDGIGPASAEPLNLEARDAADRVWVGLELVRLRKAPVLVLGGVADRYGHWSPGKNATIRNWVRSWGLSEVRILDLGPCRNTRDEAMRTQRLASEGGWKRILLVTSAYHMKRSEATFKKAGLSVVCVGCDLEGIPKLRDQTVHYHLPELEDFRIMSLYLKERIGWWLYRLRGWA